MLNDPALSASQPAEELAASVANAVGHAVEAPLTSLASPVPTLAAREALGHLARGRHARTSLGCATLPNGNAVTLEGVAALRPDAA